MENHFTREKDGHRPNPLNNALLTNPFPYAMRKRKKKKKFSSGGVEDKPAMKLPTPICLLHIPRAFLTYDTQTRRRIHDHACIASPPPHVPQDRVTSNFFGYVVVMCGAKRTQGRP